MALRIIPAFGWETSHCYAQGQKQGIKGRNIVLKIASYIPLLSLIQGVGFLIVMAKDSQKNRAAEKARFTARFVMAALQLGPILFLMDAVTTASREIMHKKSKQTPHPVGLEFSQASKMRAESRRNRFRGDLEAF